MIFIHHAFTLCIEQLVYSGRVQKTGVTALLNIADPVEHAARRRTWNRAMNSAALKDYDGIVKAKVTELMDALAQRVTQTLDISQWFGFFGYEIVLPTVDSASELT